MARYLPLLSLISVLLLSNVSTVHAQAIESCDQPGIPINSNLPGVLDGVMVTQDFTVADANILVTVAHSFIGELSIDVLAPDGTEVRLHAGQGLAADDIDVIFDDAGVDNGALPYDCRCPMLPSGPGTMADYEGGPAEGIWIISVEDTEPEEEDGVLLEWCVFLSETEPSPPTLPIFDLTCGSESGSGVIDANWSLGGIYDAIHVYLDGVLHATLPGDATAYSTDPLPLATYTLCVEPEVGGENLAPDCCTVALTDFIRGDCDGDGVFNGLLDGLRALNFRFIPLTPVPPCMEACDIDGNESFNGLLDGLHALNHQFVPGIPGPPAPYPECGPDPDPTSSLSCIFPPTACVP